MRKIESLNKKWKFVQKETTFETLAKAKAQNVNIPHTWNNLDGQDGGGN